MSKFEVMVINLERRQDRREHIDAMLEQEGDTVPWRFVRAVDGAEIDMGIGAGNLVDSRTAACWASHQKCFREFLQSSNDFLLILEDDAVLRPPSGRLRTEVESWIRIMRDLELAVFQVGFVESDSLFQKLKDGLWKTFRDFDVVKKKFPAVAKHSFLPGTHGYLVSRGGAKALLSLSGPIWLAADALLMNFADSMRHYDQFTVGRVRVSEIRQLPVSDVNKSDVQK